MRKIFLTTIVIIITASSCFSQIDPFTGRPPEPPPFFESRLFMTDAVVFYNKSSSPARLDLYMSIPFSGIQFAKDSTAGNMYSARVEYYITLTNSSDSILSNERKELKISEEYSSKLFKIGSRILVKNYDLYPGKYKLNITLTDLNTQKKSSADYETEALNNSGKEIYASDMLLLKSFEKNSDGKTSITPMISDDVGRSKDYYIFYEAYNSTSGTLTKEFTYSFKDNGGNVISSRKQSYTLQPGTNTIIEKFSSTAFEEEDFVLEVYDPNGKLLSEKYLLNRPIFNYSGDRVFPRKN